MADNNPDLTVSWATCGDDKHWCNLMTLDLDSINVTAGVYIIWHGGDNATIVRIGQGNIADRLGNHQDDSKILKYKEHGLFVTWASVDEEYLDGVEAYLGDALPPLVGDRFPDCPHISVNSPWD